MMMTRKELEAKLDAEVAAGEITPEEADQEWLNYMHRDEVWNEF